MTFQPFGYPFEIKSPHPSAEAKRVIRSRSKGWFDRKNGARGWIIGPFICLWFSAFDRYGPMLFGRISSDGFGTRVRGRAGSDLNGVVMFSLLLPILGFAAFKMIEQGTASRGELLLMAALILGGGPLVLWAAHKGRRDAEPLVRFLRDALTASGRTLWGPSGAVTIAEGFSLDVGGERVAGPVSPTVIHDALLGVGPENFVILEFGPETYLQTASHEGGYVIEKREGDGQHHFQAIRRNGGGAAGQQATVFDFDEVRDMFMAYASASAMPHFVEWEPMQLPG